MFIQTLSTFDQYSNLVLLNAVERRILPVKPDPSAQQTQQPPLLYYYTDIDLGGLYCVRGENMVLLGRHSPETFGGQRLDWAEWQRKYQEQGSSASTTEWDFDSDLIA